MMLLREWATGLCVAGIGCSLLHLLCPPGSTQKLFKTLTAVFFFCSLLSPLTVLPELIGSLLPDFSVTEPTETLTDKTEEQVMRLVDDQLTTQVQALLDPYEVIVKKAEANRDTSREDNIYIKSIMVTVDKQSFPVPREIYSVLEQALGTVVEVQYAG